MTPELLTIYAEICAANARIAAMQAENAHRDSLGHGPLYGENAFFDEADKLAQLAISARNAACPI